MRDYKDSISTRGKTWKQDARKLMESGAEFVLVHVSKGDYRDCVALAQEFDYDLALEDKPPLREEIVEQFPDRLPTQLGFVKRGSLKKKSK